MLSILEQPQALLDSRRYNRLLDKVWEAIVWALAIGVALIGASGLITRYGRVLNPNANPALEERVNDQGREIRHLSDKVDALNALVALNTQSYQAMIAEDYAQQRELRRMRHDLLMHERDIIRDFTTALRGNGAAQAK